MIKFSIKDTAIHTSIMDLKFSVSFFMTLK